MSTTFVVYSKCQFLSSNIQLHPIYVIIYTQYDIMKSNLCVVLFGFDTVHRYNKKDTNSNTFNTLRLRGNLRLFPKKVDFFGLPLVEIDRSSINCHQWKQLCKPKIYFQTNENVFLSNPHVKNRYQFCDGLRRSNWESSPSHDIWNRKRKLPHAEGWGDDGRVVYSYGWGCVKKGCVNAGGGGNTWPW